MKPNGMTPVFIAVVAIFGGLVACNCVGFPPAPPVKNPVPGNPDVVTDIKPSFVLETGIMDTWGKEKAGSLQLAVSPDGKYLVSLAHANAENIQVWDLKTKKKLHAIRSDIGTMHAHIAIANDSKIAAYTQFRPKHAIILFDLVTGKPIRTIEDDKRIWSNSPQLSMRFTPDGKQIALACKQEIAFWDTETGELKRTYPEPLEVYALTPFFAKGTRLASTNGGRVKIWDVENSKVIKTLEGAARPIAITPDEKTLISQDGMVRVFDVATGKMLREAKEFSGTYQYIAMLPDNRTAIWPTNVGFIVYDFVNMTKKQEIKTNNPYSMGLTITPDGSTLITSATDGTIKGWRINVAGMVE